MHVHRELILGNSSKLQHHSILFVRIDKLEIFHRSHGDSSVEVQDIGADLEKESTYEICLAATASTSGSSKDRTRWNRIQDHGTGYNNMQ